ncbi:MAG: PAS domain S-box protein [Myxococcales bacterium]|nr:PAS domain S-box protein [Myxococcales bacterium]
MASDEEERLREEAETLRAKLESLEARAERAERALREARAIHDATIESLPFDFWARDSQGYCFSQNATTMSNWGDLRNKRPQDMGLPAEVVELWLSNNRRALAGEIVRGDRDFTKDGVKRSVHNILAPIRMGDAIVGTLGVNIDITERKRAESERLEALRALRASQEMLRLAAEASGIAFWSWSEGKDIVWEPTANKIFGIADGASFGGREAYLALVHEDDRGRVASSLPRVMESGAWDDTHRIVRPDGTVRWVLAKGRAVRDGEHAVVVGALIDMTEQHVRDERLRQAQKLEAVGQLTAGIAHNFNNMLMSILPYLEMAQARAPADIKPLLHTAEQSAERARDLVRQLMIYAGRGRASARRTAPIAPLVERTVALCRTTFDRRITLALETDPSAVAAVDEVQLEQALLNLLLNARDALADPGMRAPEIRVVVDVVPHGTAGLEGREGDHVRVRVIDNGVGMAAQTMQRIYEPFFTTKDVGKGTGLGLATTHAIMREHGGVITCEGSPGKGSTFALYLPRETLGSAARPKATNVPEPGRETILVIDDEDPVRWAVGETLRLAGYTALTASSGPEALEMLAREPLRGAVALMLVDVSMPGMPRAELRRRLEAAAPQAKIAYFTGYSSEAIDAGDPVLEKPISSGRLLSAIRSMLDERPYTEDRMP